MAELFEKLGVDWKLLIAQIINFAILFFVLRKFAYRPILGALDRRSKTIEKSLDDAKKLEVGVRELEEEKSRVITEARREAGEIIDRARKDADAFSVKSRDEAQAHAADIVSKAKQQVTDMKDAVMSDAKEELADLVVAATEKVIRAKVTSASDMKMVESALKKVEIE